MRRSLRRSLAATALALFAAQAHATNWVCSGGPTATRAETNTTKKPRGRTQIERVDLQQAYAGQPVLLGHTWLLAVMLPATHPDTRQAFGELGISAEAAERMASGSGLVDRGIRVVQTPAQMLDKLANNPPAVGYTGFFTGGRDVALCF